MSISKRELNKIKKKIEKPYSKRIAEKIKVSSSLVVAVMNGHRKDNHGIIDACLDDIQRQKQRKEEKNRKIKQQIKHI